MKTYQVPREVFEEACCQLEGARDELNDLISQIEWFVSQTPERIDKLLDVLSEIEEEQS